MNDNLGIEKIITVNLKTNLDQLGYVYVVGVQ